MSKKTQTRTTADIQAEIQAQQDVIGETEMQRAALVNRMADSADNMPELENEYSLLEARIKGRMARIDLLEAEHKTVYEAELLAEFTTELESVRKVQHECAELEADINRRAAELEAMKNTHYEQTQHANKRASKLGARLQRWVREGVVTNPAPFYDAHNPAPVSDTIYHMARAERLAAEKAQQAEAVSPAASGGYFFSR